jgi:tetratricopeptide (TPR) repeat protein
MVKSDKDELLSAVWDGKKGYDYLCDALEIEPKNYDAQMGVGFFNYYLSYLPKAFQWIAKVIGFAPNRELGLKMLERTATKGLYAKNEARWWLSIFYQAEDKPEKGLQYLKSLCDDYPFNPYCVQEYGFLLLFQLHRVDDAIPVFQKAITMTNKEAERYIFQGYQRLGHAYRFKNQWQEAIAWYKKFLTLETSDTARINNVNYNIGLCYELSGDRTTALPYYQRSSRSSKERLKKPMTGFDIEIEKMKNHFNAGYKAKGFDAGSALLARQDMSDDERAVILMELGSTYFEEKEYTQAAMHFTQITGLTIKEKNWLVPYAHYQLGLCFLRNVQKGLAKQSFEKVLTFENYENEERIKEATEEELDKIDD